MLFQSITRISSSLILLLFASVALAQDSGDADLDAAFDLKIKCEKLGDYEKVVELCKSAIEKGLDSEGKAEAEKLAASALYDQGEQLMLRMQRQIQRGRDATFFRKQGVKLLKEAVEFDPEMGAAWLLLAKMNLVRGGDPDEARSSVDQAISLLDEDPQKGSEAYLLRSMLSQKEDREGAKDDLNKSIELNASNVGALRARSTILILEGDVEAGLADSSKFLEVSGNKVNAHLVQGATLEKLANAKQAAAFARQNADDSEEDAGSDQVEDAFAKQSVEELEADAKKIRQAILEIYTKVVELEPENVQYYILKANAQENLELKEEALSTIEQLIEKDDKSVVALRKKAEILLTDKENDAETLETLDLAVELDPYDMMTRRLRMQYFSAREQFGDAIKEAKKIMDKEPNNSSIMNRLALLYSLNEEPEEAIEIYGELLSRMPTRFMQELPPRNRPIFLAQKIGTLRSRGDAYLSTGEHEQAIDDYEEALDLGDQIEEMMASLSASEFEYKPDDGVLNNLAWVLATSTYDDLRDGKRAIELATLACEVTDYKMPHILSTLASGYAETGDFDKAIEWIEKGLEVNEARELDEIVTEAEKKRQKESLEKELAHYRQKKPWRENQAEEDAAAKEEAEKKADADEAAEKDASAETDEAAGEGDAGDDVPEEGNESADKEPADTEDEGTKENQ